MVRSRLTAKHVPDPCRSIAAEVFSLDYHFDSSYSNLAERRAHFSSGQGYQRTG